MTVMLTLRCLVRLWSESSSGSLLIGYATWSSAIHCRAMHTLDYRWAYVVNADNTLSIRWYKLSMLSKRSVYVTNTLCIRPTRYEYAKNLKKKNINSSAYASVLHTFSYVGICWLKPLSHLDVLSSVWQCIKMYVKRWRTLNYWCFFFFQFWAYS